MPSLYLLCGDLMTGKLNAELPGDNAPSVKCKVDEKSSNSIYLVLNLRKIKIRC